MVLRSVPEYCVGRVEVTFESVIHFLVDSLQDEQEEDVTLAPAEVSALIEGFQKMSAMIQTAAGIIETLEETVEQQKEVGAKLWIP